MLQEIIEKCLSTLNLFIYKTFERQKIIKHTLYKINFQTEKIHKCHFQDTAVRISPS